MSEPDWVTARANLSRAISEFYEAMTGEYVDGWVLVTHKLSPHLEQQGQTAVGVLTMQGQSFVLSRGLIEIACENPAFAGRPEGE